MSIIIKEVKFKETGIYLGRNGTARMKGIHVNNGSADRIYIHPINSRQMVGRCYLGIPKEHIDEVIAALQQIPH